MSAIRPGLPATTLPVPGEGGRARQAQSAFFRAAMEAASPAAQPRAASAPAPTSPAVRPVQTSQGASQNASQPGAEPTRLLRPGSLLDIRI
ncbi:hypothetical protein [Brevundimonas sp. UBA7534]|uniref:hypothetical protein n=1 Tax=Brevundimonas sp. UBA7534 TaxID=1946138 RepID=UPI0025BB4B25|nr:hypothetical protein [Brevundimonas sp. UBA7534]